MKALLQRTGINVNLAKLGEWGKLITMVGSAQVVVQALGFLSGIIIIRQLPTHEYALYTLANTMLGTMTVLADGGIAMGVMSQGGKVWLDQQQLGVVVSTGLQLRKRFAVVSLIIAIPLLVILLTRHGASWQLCALIILSIVPAFTMALSGELLEIAPKLHQDIAPLQKIQVGINIQRLLLVVSIFVFPWAFIAILAAGLPQIWANRQLRKLTAGYADRQQQPSPQVKKQILKLVKRLLPGSVYYCLSGQITIWLISIFGTTRAVAQAGALGRLSMMLTLISVLFSTLIGPRFARLPARRNVLLSKYIQIQIGLFSLCAFIVFMVWMFPAQTLWILGKSYADLKIEIVLSILGSCLALIAGSAYSLYANRGWAMYPVLIIPFNIGIIILGATLIDISTLKGILSLNIFVSTIEIVVSASFTLYKIFQQKETSLQPTLA